MYAFIVVHYLHTKSFFIKTFFTYKQGLGLGLSAPQMRPRYINFNLIWCLWMILLIVGVLSRLCQFLSNSQLLFVTEAGIHQKPDGVKNEHQKVKPTLIFLHCQLYGHLSLAIPP